MFEWFVDGLRAVCQWSGFESWLRLSFPHIL